MEKVHVITPSYVTEEIRSLDKSAKNNDVLILNDVFRSWDRSYVR